jgi:hypothetical protein
MSDDHERDDECAKVYRKSLLYLIHHALEEDHEAQLLGMERCLRADHTLAKAFGLTGIRSAGEVVWSICNDGPRHASASTSHGGFDNDPATMESVCRRILRKDAIVKFPPAARSFADLAGPDDTELEILGLLAGAGQQSGNFPAGPAVIVKPGPAAAKRRGHHALCIGIDNYPNPASRLSGCVADARLWANVLAARGFSVTTLVDADAHRDAMIQAIAALLDEAEPGDVRVIQYSGHGTHVEDLDGDEKTDRGPGRDEALCCFDYARGNLLIDDDLAQIVARVPAGVNITFFMDCCHSGTNTRFAAPSVNQAADDKRVARHVTLTDEEMACYRTARGTPPRTRGTRDVDRDPLRRSLRRGRRSPVFRLPARRTFLRAGRPRDLHPFGHPGSRRVPARHFPRGLPPAGAGADARRGEARQNPGFYCDPALATRTLLTAFT